MSVVRSAARRILVFVVRNSRRESRGWGYAMLRELDYVENDWAALRWVLGSTTVLFRHSVIQIARAWWSSTTREGAWLGRRGWMASVLSGVAAAGAVLAISALVLAILVRASWLEPSQGKLAEPLFVVVIPDAVGLLAAVALWRPRTRMASGVLAAGTAFVAHSIIYFIA